MLSRRTLLATSAGLLGAACTRQKASGYSGFAFVANEEGQAIAAVDLTVFAVARHIRLDGRPTGVVSHPGRPFVYALTPANGTIHEIRSDTLQFARKATIARSALSMRLSPGGKHLYVLCREPRQLVKFALEPFHIEWKAPLPADPADFDLDRTGQTLAISYGPLRALSLLDASQPQSTALIHAEGDIGTLRFRTDSRAILAANTSDRTLAIYDVASRQLIVNLPLAVRPDHVCFNADGGQFFITGEGTDGVVVVFPYHVPEVAETVLAGHAPGAMATTQLRGSRPQYLFVANPTSGDVSILDITKRRLVAVTPAGSGPSYITLTPDDQYALVLNQVSGDVAVIRIANLTRATTDFKRWRKGPLFMMIPVGSKPVSASVLPI